MGLMDSEFTSKVSRKECSTRESARSWAKVEEQMKNLGLAEVPACPAGQFGMGTSGGIGGV